MSTIETQSRTALAELITLLQDVDRRWASAEWNLLGPDDVVGAHRALMHMIQCGLTTYFESDPAHPRWQRIVTPTCKITGDNADAIYHDAAVDPAWQYIVRGRMDGAVYVSFTVECDAADGRMSTRTGGVLNDTQFDVDADGRFELHFGGPPRARNWMALEPGASRITTRYYYENERSGAADPTRHAALEIEAVGVDGPPPPPDDAGVTAAIHRIAQFVKARTLDMPPMANSPPPPFVSIVPNQFPKPVRPGDYGLAAADAAYSMAPFVIGPDDALVMTARWPRCRCANVSLWNRFMQTLDYANRTVSRNRAQTTLRGDGSFEIVLAHRDPGHPNWIDTEGRAFGLVFWRYMLPEGEIETPVAEVVKLSDVARR